MHSNSAKDACTIIEQARVYAYHAVDETLIKRNWLLGLRIQHEVLKDQRAEYGEQVIKSLSKALTKRYGEGFTKTNLYNYICFYQYWPDFFHAVSGKSENILKMLYSHSPIRLSWTHYRIILQEQNQEARAWYEEEAAREMWSTRALTLCCQIPHLHAHPRGTPPRNRAAKGVFQITERGIEVHYW